MTLRLTLAGLFAALAALLLPTLPASATNDTNNPEWTTPTRCVTYGPDSETTCEYLSWHRQADDSGVTVDGAHVWNTNACPQNYEATPYSPVRWYGYYADGSPKNNGDWSDGDCNFSRTVNFNGADNGSAQFLVYVHARLDVAHDKNLRFEWQVYPNGDSTLIKAEVTSCPCL